MHTHTLRTDELHCLRRKQAPGHRGQAAALTDEVPAGKVGSYGQLGQAEQREAQPRVTGPQQVKAEKQASQEQWGS